MARTNNKDVHRGVVLYLDGKEIPNNARAIRAEMKKVREEIDGMTRGSEEYYRATKKYRELDKILQQHRAELKHVEQQQTSILQRGIKFFRDYSLQITGAIAALTGVAMELNKFRKQAAGKEDAAANLKALTGLDDENIQWLTQQAEILSTTMEASGLRVRKSATEILEAYMLVGSKKPELLQDKEALNAVTIEAMRLAEAAKMELKDAVAGLTLAMNQYGASAEEAARYVNVLAAGSKFGAVGVATQTESIVKAGVAANMAKVPIEQLVGVLETLGERGIEGQIAGTQLKTFFLKLEAGAEDTRPSVVGLQQALETLAAKNLDVTQMTKMFGLESISTAKALISSAEKVRYYTEAVTDTNTAVEQARINSDTTAARMAQIRNQISLTGQQLAKDLAPILNKTIGWTRKFVMMLPGLIDFISKNKGTLLTLAAAYAAYSTALHLSTIKLKIHNAWVATTTAATKAYTVVVQTLRTAKLALQVATAGLTGNLARENALMIDLKKNAANLKNVYALMAAAVVAAIAAIVVALKRQRNEQKLLNDIEREARRNTSEDIKRIEILKAVIENETISINNRRKAIEDLQAIIPDYHASLTDEGKLIGHNAQLLRIYTEQLKNTAKIQAALAKLPGAEEKVRDLQNGASERMTNALVMEKTEGMSEEEAAGRAQVSPSAYRAWKASLEEANRELKTLNKIIEDLSQKNQKLADSISTVSTAEGDAGGSGSGDTGGETDRQKRIREAIEAINVEYDARANDLKQQYIDGQIATEEEYGKQLQALELERLNKQLEIAGLEPEKREQIRAKILDMTIKLREQLKQQDEKQKQEAEKAATERLNLSRQTMQDALTEMRRTRIEEGLTEEEYAQRILEIRRAFYQKALEDQSLSDKERQQLQREANELEISEEERKQKRLDELAQQQEDRQRQLFDTLRSAGEEFGEALGDFLTDTEATFKDFSKELLKIVVKTVKNIMVAAIVQRTVENIRTLGFWGVAKAAGEIALIEAAGAALNGLVDNFYIGGYTGQGRWDEPRGVVHAGEFVANRYAVANDAVRPVLDLIDQAQKNGSIANLTAADIAAVATPARPSSPPSPASPSSPSSATVPGASASGQPRDPELTAALHLLTRTTARAAEAYREPSTAYCYLEGRGGINTAQDMLTQIKNNASRK